MIPRKRAVARHACLACREKKVKCDGETPVPPGEKQVEIKTQKCTNCKTTGIQCIFVPSQRGGRRKKEAESNASIVNTNTDVSASISTQATSRNDNGNEETFSSTKPPANQTYLQPKSDIAAQTDSHHQNLSRPIEMIYSSGSNNTLKEQVRQLQRDTANIQSQLLSTPALHGIPVNEYYQPLTKSIPQGADQDTTAGPYQQPYNQYPHDFQPIQSQGFQYNTWPPQHSMTGPITHSSSTNSLPVYPLAAAVQTSLSRPSVRPHSLSTQHSPTYSGFQAGQSASAYSTLKTSPNSLKRPASNDLESFQQLPKMTRPELFIQIPDEELEKFDLPNWKTTCILIDLYYRYIHPSRPFLPSKHRLVYQIQIRQDASLLHAMFSCSSRFASSIDIPNPNFRDSQHWYFLAEKYWDLLDMETSLQALVLLMGALGPGGYVQQAIEGSEKFAKKIHVNGFYQTLLIKDWQDYASCATKKQIIRHEDMLRTVWGSWKLNVFLRINRGFPFSAISEELVRFMSDLPLPLSDSDFNCNLSIFDTTDTQCLTKLEYRTWASVAKDLERAKTDKSLYKTFTDAELIIIAVKTMEDIMDTISCGFLNSNTISDINAKITLIEDITNTSLYHLSHIKKKMIVINISKMFALLLLTVAKQVTNVTQCAQILLIKPHETNSNSHPDDVFNSLYESKLDTIKEAATKITPEQLTHYFTAFKAALEGVRLVDVGRGLVPEEMTSLQQTAVIGGPLNFTSAAEISSMKISENWWTTAVPEPGHTLSAQAQTFNEFPDAWIQYPIFSVVCIANALTVLSSSIVLTKFLTIHDLGTKEGYKHIEVVLSDGTRIIPVALPGVGFDDCIKAFEIHSLQEKVRVCLKFIQAHGNYWPYVESISTQAQAIINFVDDVISKMQ